MTVTCRDSFAAAHVLSGYEGKCKNLHGHTYHIEATAVSRSRNNMGMVVDFNILKRLVSETIEEYDHAFLYGVVHREETTTDSVICSTCEKLGLKIKYIWSGYSTTESIARQILSELNNKLADTSYHFTKIRLSESDKTYAEVFADE